MGVVYVCIRLLSATGRLPKRLENIGNIRAIKINFTIFITFFSVSRHPYLFFFLQFVGGGDPHLLAYLLEQSVFVCFVFFFNDVR